MIKNDAEYLAVLRRLNIDRQLAEEQSVSLKMAGLSEERIRHAMEPVRRFQQQLAQDVALYENQLRQRLFRVQRLTQIGPLLVGLRVASGISQHELGRRSGVSQSAVCRDEQRGYRGISLERAQRILDALGVSLSIAVESTTLMEEGQPPIAAAG